MNLEIVVSVIVAALCDSVVRRVRLSDGDGELCVG
jgi:hypothetical protein